MSGLGLLLLMVSGLLLSHSTSSTSASCPQIHQCNCFPLGYDTYSQQCHNHSTAPSKVAPNTVLLSLNGVHDNRITHLSTGAFDGWVNLTYLEILDNDLRSIQVGAFRALARLRNLYLTRNKLVVLERSTFIGMTSLLQLHLDNNLIKTIYPGSFEGLSRLILLSIGQNVLDRFYPDTIFEIRHRLMYLRLGSNKLKHINSTSFQGVTRLIALYLNYNQLSFIGNGTFQHMTYLTYLHLDHNALQVITAGMMSGLVYLFQLYLNNNHIKYIEAGTFSDLRNTVVMHFEVNHLEVLNPEMLDGPNPSYLEFKENAITEIHDGSFKGCTRVVFLSLRTNSIQSIHPETFKGLNVLRSLYLDWNNITRLEKHIFDENIKLEVLDVTDNRLEHLDKDVLTYAASLIILSLSSNRLTHLHPDIFMNTSLIFLDLSNNELLRMPNLWSNPIEFLLLANNRITSIPENTFESSTTLRYAFFDNNKIEVIKTKTFKGATSIEKIALSLNPLKVIEENAFVSLPKLSTVFLIDTHIVVPLRLDSLPSSTLFATYKIFFGRFSAEGNNEGLKVTSHRYDVRKALRRIGFFCDIARNCRPCDRGTYKYNRSCKACPPGGFYQEEMGYSGLMVHGVGCKQCPPGSYVKPEQAPGKSETDCQSCPKGTNTRKYSKFRACSCMKDHYRLDRFGPCLLCTKGYLCSNERVDLAPGFYWNWSTSGMRAKYSNFTVGLNVSSMSYTHRAFDGEIPLAHACPVMESCLGGEDSSCSEGYKGPLCAVCSKGYYNMLTKCQECPTLPWIVGQIILVLAIAIVSIAIAIRQRKSHPDASPRTLSDIFLARLKIVIGFYQVAASTFESFSYINWPGPLLTLMKYGKLVQLNLLQIVPLHCIKDTIRTNAYTHLMVSVGITGVIVLSGCLYIAVMKLYIQRQSASKEILDKKIYESAQTCHRLVFLSLFITYPTTCKHILQVLPSACHVICSSQSSQCFAYLKADYSVQCYTDKHNTFGAIFSRIAITYVVGFPVLLLLILRGLSRMSQESSSVQKSAIVSGVKFLYENYSPSCWFWEIVELVRKVLITSILLLMTAESRTSLGLTAIISGLYTIMFALHKPIEDVFEHWLQLVSLMASSANFSAGMLLKIPVDEESSSINQERDTIGVTIILIAANVIVVAIVAAKYIFSVVTKVLEIKKNQECSLACCLDVIQIADEACADVYGAESNVKGLTSKSAHGAVSVSE